MGSSEPADRRARPAPSDTSMAFAPVKPTGPLASGPVTDRAVARHEAGHAVAAYWLKRDVVSLSIEPDEQTLGRIVMRSSRRMLHRIATGILDRHARQQVENQVMTLLAGGIASDIRRGCEDDHAMAATLVLALSSSDAEAQAYAAWLRERTIVLMGLPPSATALHAITEELLRQRTLTGSAAHRVVHQAFRDLVAP